MRFFTLSALLACMLACAHVFADLYTASKAVIRVTAQQGADVVVGSGIVVGSDGTYYYALTNAHVACTQRVQVEFFDAGRITKAAADTVMRDTAADLAVLKIKSDGYCPTIIPIDPSFTMAEGDVLATIGHPQGRYPTTYFCTYSKTDTTFGLYFRPPPMHGRSGSPLLDTDGSRVVGIVYGYLDDNSAGLAVPASVVADFVQAGMTGARRTKAWKLPRESGVVHFSGDISGEVSILDTSADRSADTPRTERFLRRPELPKVKELRERLRKAVPRPKPRPKPQADPAPELTLAQYFYSPCPGGTCPTPQVTTPRTAPKSPDIPTPETPIRVEVVPRPKAVEKPPDDTVAQAVEAQRKYLLTLKERVEKLEGRVETLEKADAPTAESSGLFNGKSSVEEGLRSGISDGAKILADAVEVKFGDETRTLLTSASSGITTSSTALTAAALTANKSLETATADLTRTTDAIDATAAVIRQKADRLEWYLLALTIVLGIKFMYGVIKK